MILKNLLKKYGCIALLLGNTTTTFADWQELAKIKYQLARVIINSDEVRYIFHTCREIVKTEKFGNFYVTLGLSQEEDDEFSKFEVSKIGQEVKNLAKTISSETSNIQDIKDICFKLSKVIYANKKQLMSPPFSTDPFSS